MNSQENNDLPNTKAITSGVCFALIWTIITHYLGDNPWISAIGYGALGGLLNYLLYVTFSLFE